MHVDLGRRKGMALLRDTVINWYLLWLIFGIVILAKFVKIWSPKLCNQVAMWFVAESQDLINLKREMGDMRIQLRQINMMNDFAEHARLQRRIIKKDEELQSKEKSHKTQLTKLNVVLRGTSTVLTLLLRVGVVMYNRQRPVAILPTELFYPLSPILAFPTGQSGAIGCPVWAVASSLFIDTVMYLLNTLFVEN